MLGLLKWKGCTIVVNAIATAELRLAGANVRAREHAYLGPWILKSKIPWRVLKITLKVEREVAKVNGDKNVAVCAPPVVTIESIPPALMSDDMVDAIFWEKESPNTSMPSSALFLPRRITCPPIVRPHCDERLLWAMMGGKCANTHEKR